MTTDFRLNEIMITEPQTRYFVEIYKNALAVESAPFGDTAAMDSFRALADRVDDIFGAGASDASADIEDGFVNVSEGTIQALLLIEAIVGMATAENHASFGSYLTTYKGYYEDEFVPDYLIAYGITDY